MAANSDYVSTFTTVLETVQEKCEELCQIFFEQGIEYCAKLYEQDKDTLHRERIKQNYSPSERSILLAVGIIKQIQKNSNNIKSILTEMDQFDLDRVKSEVMASADGPRWKKAYDSNCAQFKCDELKKLWEAVEFMRFVISKIDGVKDLTEKIFLSNKMINDETIGLANTHLQHLSLRLHPNSQNYYAKEIGFLDKKEIGFLDKFAALFFKIDVRNIPASSHSAKSLARESVPLDISRNGDSQLWSPLFTQSAPSGNDFLNSRKSSGSDMSLPSSREVSGADVSSDEEMGNFIRRPLTPRA